MDTTQPLLRTPLYGAHLSRNAKMAPFGGWMMPIQYEGILAEHSHTRTAVSVFDICHMGEFMLEGDPVSSGLDRVVTQRIVSMPVGACRYGFMLNDKGGILDDLVVYRLGVSSWMIVVNAATQGNDERHMRAALKGNCRLDNLSDALGKIDVQGPLSLEAVKGVAGEKVGGLGYYTSAKFQVMGEEAVISRSGYTGELGYEIYFPSDKILDLWEKLLENKDVKPAGLGCRDTLRLEMAYPLYGQDLDESKNPLQAGFSKYVDFSKDFIGKDALLAEKQDGPAWHLRCFSASSRRAPRHGYGIFAGQERVGTVTSGSFSPSLGVGIGMGYVSRPLAEGFDLLIKDANIEIPAKIVTRPFYKKGTAKS